MVEEMLEPKIEPTEENQQPADGAQSAEVTTKNAEYIKELTKEKLALDPETHSVAMRLLDEEISRAQKGKNKDPKNIFDLYRDRPIRASVKVSVPVKEHPRFNFVGKLLGPKGNTLKRLQEETMTKMAILGRGSMRDKNKEDECRASLDPKYAHLSDDLHVEIFASGPPAEAHARLAYAMVEIRKYLMPDVTEDIMHPDAGGPIRGRGPGGRGGFRGGMMGPPPVPHPRAAAGANKVMSILDRARMSMEGGFGGPFEEGPGGYGYDPSYDNGAGYGGEFDYGAGAAGLGGRWKGYGPKAPGAGASRFPPRPAPYNRPPNAQKNFGGGFINRNGSNNSSVPTKTYGFSSVPKKTYGFNAVPKKTYGFNETL